MVIGQLEGVKRMIDEDRNCFEVLPQLKAVNSAVQAVTQQYLAKHMESCLSECSAEERSELCATFIKELIKIS